MIDPDRGMGDGKDRQRGLTGKADAARARAGSFLVRIWFDFGSFSVRSWFVFGSFFSVNLLF
jgi:hypothetical protein